MTRDRIYSKGEFIGPYEVERVLATGGMGIVYQAKPSPEHRADLLAMGVDQVALKMVRLGSSELTRYDRKLLVERLDREFATLVKLTRLGHPHVVRVYDSGREDGVPYYVMELVDGITLDEALAEQPRWGEMMSVFGQLCGAVAFLHEVGVCHRDLKPSNVMIRRDGGEPVLIDFGICLPPSERTLTGPRDLLGTAQYLSPEYGAHWLEGATRPYVAAPTDDVWALGVMLYEILTGGTPWRTPPERREALLKEIQEVTPAHPTEVNPKAPPALGDVAMKMLERDFQKRPRNAMEVLPILGEAAEFSDAFGRVPGRRPAPKPLKTTWAGGGAERQTAPAGQRARRTTHQAMPHAGQRSRLRDVATWTAIIILLLIGVWIRDARMMAELERQHQELTSAMRQGRYQLDVGARLGAGDNGTFTAGVSSEIPFGNAIPAAYYGGALGWNKAVLGEWPIPPVPIQYQQRPPCQSKAEEINGGCWAAQWSVLPGQSCGNFFRKGNTCYSPIRDPKYPFPDDPKSPRSQWPVP